MINTEQSLTFKDQAGHQMSAILATPETPSTRLAILCHGFLSNKSSATNRALTALLIKQGIATLRFDFFGHGDSDGPFERLTIAIAVDQALAALAVAKARGYSNLALVGSSFGGLVAVLAAARWPSHPSTPGDVTPARPEPARTGSFPMAPARPEPARTGSFPAGRAPSRSLACLALKCPVSDFPTMLRDEFGEAGLREWQASNTIPNVIGGVGRIRLSFSFFEECGRHLAYEAARQVAVPTLIVHGDADEYVAIAQSIRLKESLAGPASLVVIPGANHHFSQPAHFREMTERIGGWVAGMLNT